MPFKKKKRESLNKSGKREDRGGARVKTEEVGGCSSQEDGYDRRREDKSGRIERTTSSGVKGMRS